MQTYNEYVNDMEKSFPYMYGGYYGGFEIGAGWYDLVRVLSANIDHYVRWRRSLRARAILETRAAMKGRDALVKFLAGKREPREYDYICADRILEDPKELPEYTYKVRVDQVKEKFGTLRFYYSGGDEHVRGLVSMAESMSAYICEDCGNKGQRRDGGWIRTLCDHHEEEYQRKKQA